MADVFISYARDDRAIAERLADAITTAGKSVWWDRHIKGGAEFARDIEAQLDAATHVLVLWSKDAVNSRWVKDEASEAAESGRLIAASIDGTPPPLGFRQFHTIELAAWAKKGAEIPAELADALDAEVRAPTASYAKEASKPFWKKPAFIAALVAAFVAAFATIWTIFPVKMFPRGEERSFLRSSLTMSVSYQSSSIWEGLSPMTY